MQSRPSKNIAWTMPFERRSLMKGIASEAMKLSNVASKIGSISSGVAFFCPNLMKIKSIFYFKKVLLIDL